WQLLFTSNVWMPAGGGDLAGFIYPTYHFAQEWITRGVIPLWNPYIFGGTPFVGDIQTALFYPLNLLTDFLSNPLTYRDLEYLSVLHFYIASAGMYALLRFGPFTCDNRPLHRFACLAGAVAFAFSDLFITHFGNLNLIASAAWLPLIFLFLMRAIEANTAPLVNKASLAYALLTAIILAISFFAGHIQPFLFIVLVLALYTGYSIALQPVDWKRITLIFVIALGIGAGLSAITLLPALELTRLSIRSAFTYQDAAQFSLPPLELFGMLVPGFFGRGPENAWGPWTRVEVGYIGIFPLILAIVALVLRRNAKMMFFALIALVGLLLALGGYSILHGWLFQFVPGFGQLRAPARFVFLFDFGLAALAAIGFDALVSPMSQDRRNKFQRIVRRGVWIAFALALVSGALALGILILGQGQDPTLFQRIANAANALAFFILLLAFSLALLMVLTREWLSKRAWSLLALALIFFDLFSLGAYVDVGTSDPTLGYQRADIIDFLRANTGLARIDSRTDVEGVWRPETGLLYGLQDVYGDNPLVLNDFDAYWEKLGGRSSYLYRMLNVNYVLVRRGTPLPSNFTKVFDGSGSISVYQNSCTAPRAWITYNTRINNDLNSVLDSLQGDCQSIGSSIPSEIAVIVSGNGAQEFHHEDSAPSDPFTVTGYTPNEIVGNANARTDGYLFFSEVYVPGWRAFVDGQEVPVVRANYLFRAVPITAGTHEVRLVYDPLSFKLGAIISGLTFLIVVVAFMWIFLSRE
ncbi:MAG TPA: YfhO family protein, partial [Anaerolineae bacterium]|nr:YfhO family protein [Anaerolineae bacterium]